MSGTTSAVAREMSADSITEASQAPAADGGVSRSRWRVTVHETQVLEAVFMNSPRPNKPTIQQLAAVLKVKPRQVQVWFQNRRCDALTTPCAWGTCSRGAWPGTQAAVA